MAAVEIDVGDDEDLIRVYTRYPNQTGSFGKLLPKDFCRIMQSHSGISLWRLNLISHEGAMDRLNTEKLKGTAVAKAKRLKDLGFKFFAITNDDPHLSVRCPGCNLNVDYGSALCEQTNGAMCSFNLHAPYSFAATLPRNNYFKIVRQISSN